MGVLSYHFPLYSFETEAFTIKLVQGWWPAILSLPLVDTGAHNCAWLSHGCWVFMLAWRSYPLSHISLFSLHLPTFCFCFCFSGFFFSDFGNKFLLWSLKIEILLLQSPVCQNHRCALSAKLKSCPWYPSPLSTSPSSSERILFDEGNAHIDK